MDHLGYYCKRQDFCLSGEHCACCSTLPSLRIPLGSDTASVLHEVSLGSDTASEALKQLNEGQYGSRPRRNAIDPVMIEELQFEISRATSKTVIQTNYDAASCYDRIIPNLP